MDPSIVIQVADAVAAELNSANLGFTAQRHYRPQFELAELTELRVSVVPKGITITGLAQGSNQHDVAIDVALQKKVDASNLAALDELMTQVQQAADVLRLRRLATMPTSAWVQTENLPIYAPEHLDTKGVFTSVLTVTYRVVR